MAIISRLLRLLIRVLAVTGAVAARASTKASRTDGPSFLPLHPPAIPLAVRSPYLSTWLTGDSGGLLPGSWPHFWAGQITGWQGFVRVDNVTYTWMGAASGPSLVTQTAFTYTATSSVFSFDVAGLVTLTATFLSPVYPSDLVRQSTLFSYVQLAAASADGKAHSVQVYSDISGEWASPDSSKTVNWTHSVESGVVYHSFGLTEPSELSERDDMALWGTWFYATPEGAGTTFRTGFPDSDTRSQFISEGWLDNQEDTAYRAINNAWPVFALSQDLGVVSGATVETLFAVGLTQETVILFQGNSSAPAALTGLWTAHYETAAASAAAFVGDWPQQHHDAAALDARVHNDAFRAGGAGYAALCELALRQVFGSLQVAASASGQQYLFLKEISSDGDIQTVDVIFPAHPVFLYLNPELLRLLLDPLFEDQESGHYPNPWSIHDLGFFPRAVGFPGGNDEAMPVEECGNMIIMALAYAQRTGGDGAAYLAQHWPLLRQWAQFLVDDSLIPDYQLSTDDFAGPLANQTNLALKGILGVRAMAEIARLIGVADTTPGLAASDKAAAAASFLQTAQDYIAQWTDLGTNNAASPPHTTLAYNVPDSHGLLYNLYADRLLSLGLVPPAVYDMQSAFYATVIEDYGVPLDSRHDWAKSDWQAFAAAVAAPDVQALMLDRLVRFATDTSSGRPLTDLYDAATGAFPRNGPSFVNRPVQGGLFALLALP